MGIDSALSECAGSGRKVAVTYCNPEDPLLRRSLVRSVEFLTGQPKINGIYQSYRRDASGGGGDFWADAMDKLALTIRYDPDCLARVPREGALLVVANHPYGVVDGLGLCYLVSQIRPDFKFIAHATFGRAPELEPYLIPIQFDGESAALRANVSSRRTALRHLEDGGAIVIFPAGRVATAPRVFDQAIDAPWKPFCATMILRSRASVLPMHFEGKNSWLFHLVSHFSEGLREALLLGEACRRIGSEIVAHVGRTISFDEVEELHDKQLLLDFLRGEVYRLAQQD
jgi:putative hemolysin